ncbi:MAG: peptidylprolyl isomerase [Acidimicrobiales bacterium]
MPTEKRARKRAQREAKMAALERQRKRRASVRRAVIIVVLVGIAIGAYVGLSSGKKKTPTPTTTPTGDTQAAVDAVAAKAGCPSNYKTALKKQTFSSPPALSINPSATYTATVKTDIGTFKVALDAKDAPQTVNSFVFLAKHDFFNCEAFMRVIPGFMNQTGSPNQTNGGNGSGPGYSFGNENSHPASGYVAGDVAMANSGTAGTDGSQFFILAGPYNPFTSDPTSIGYSLFGTVTSGQSVVQKINSDGNTNTNANGVPPKITHRMLKVTVSTS